MAGLFITFEGIDGAGKSTQLERLADAFRAQGRCVTCTREPGGTPLAEKIRALLLADPMDPLTETLLLFAGRRDHLLQTIEPALARGDVVLSDRFTDATFAYQGGGRGFDLAVLAELESWVQRVPALAEELRQPDLTCWFDLAPEFAAARLARARAADRFEAESVDFFRRVAAGYAARVAAQSARFVRLDAAQPATQVWQQLSDALRERGWLPAPAAPGGAAP